MFKPHKTYNVKTYLLSSILLSLISCGNQDSKVLTPAQFTKGIEGPAVAPNGDVYLVNIREQGTIGKITKGKKRAELFVNLPEGSIGNGIRFNSDSTFLVADYAKHNILSVNMKTKKVSVFAHNDEMNQPNDIAVASNGNIFASDPNWQTSTGNLWLIKPTGEVVLLEADMGTTNGVEVSMSEKVLYVNESEQRKVWAYDLSEQGTVSNKRLFHQFKDGGLDGMRCDQEGNLYIARYGKGTVAVLNPKGEQIQEVKLHGKRPTNVAFGGDNGDQVFVTMQGKKWVELFQANHPGRSFKSQK